MTEVERVIDTNVQPFFRSNSEILKFLPKEFQTRSIPDVESIWYQAPGGDYITSDRGDGYPGSDPDTVAHQLFDINKSMLAVLNPLTRGNNPDYRLNSAICSATNDWLAQVWLEEANSEGKFKGTIRVNPEDPERAVAEIERYSSHPHMVQVGVPLQSREPYGKPQFRSIWEAAAESNLPVAVRVTGGVGIDYPPTPAGHTRTYPHYAAFMPLNYFYHLSSLIAEGVFERIPNLRFVFADGGIDFLAPLIWRMDTIWYASRDLTPWLTKYPSDYLHDHVRFCFNKLEGPYDSSVRERWLDMLNQRDLLMFGSSYPFWYYAQPMDISEGVSAQSQAKLLHDNAIALYNLERVTTNA